MDPTTHRYTRMAQTLHWLMALIVVSQFATAWIAEGLPKDDPAKAAIFGWHVYGGITVLTLGLIRLVWRQNNPKPALPAGTPTSVKLASYANHFAFYAMFMLQPLLGIVAITSDPATSETVGTIHAIGAKVILALLALHLAGTAYHMLMRKDGLLWRMLPGGPTRLTVAPRTE